MEGMKDWNEMNIEEYISHLENKFLVDSSGTAKAVFELIRAYRALNLPIVSNRRELLKFMDWIIEQKPRYNWMDAKTVVDNYTEDKLL